MAEINIKKLMAQAGKKSSPPPSGGDKNQRAAHGGGGTRHGGGHGGGERQRGGGGNAGGPADRQSAGSESSGNFIPMPATLVAHSAKITNFGLLFQKYAAYDNSKLEHKKTIERISKQATQALAAAANALKELHSRQEAVLKNVESSCSFTATLLSPLITGVGNAHPGEVGMTFDRNTGLPYIPASSIKGVVRMAYCVELYEDVKNKGKKNDFITENVQRNDRNIGVCIKDNEPGLVHLFGHPDPSSEDASRGQIVFLDAFPATVPNTGPNIRLDIMNPHYSSYYGGSEAPVETENPVPIKFLTVALGTAFVFRWFVRPLRGALAVAEHELDLLERAWERALTQMGLGAKTAIGYGRFDINSIEGSK